MEFTFTVFGRPRTWQRTNDVRGRRVTDKAQREAKRQIAWLALAARPKGWPMGAEYEVITLGVWPDRRYGDVDRLSSLVMDALEGVAYEQDRQVAAQTSARALDRDNPRTEVIVRVYDREDSDG